MRSIQTLPIRSNVEQLSRRFACGVILDVLRASTTAAVALDHGARAIHPCASRNEAWNRRKELRREGIDPLLCGERGGSKIEGFDLGNSPREFTREQVEGRTLIMATTNGTKALKAAERAADEIALGAYVNAGAVADRLAAGEGDALLVCSGKLGFFSVEDFIGAGLILSELLKRVPPETFQLDDASRAALEQYRMHQDRLLELLQSCSHGAYLIECGFGDDLPICAEAGSTTQVPTYRDGVLLGTKLASR